MLCQENIKQVCSTAKKISSDIIICPASVFGQFPAPSLPSPPPPRPSPMFILSFLLKYPIICEVKQPISTDCIFGNKTCYFLYIFIFYLFRFFLCRLRTIPLQGKLIFWFRLVFFNIDGEFHSSFIASTVVFLFIKYN